MAANQEWQPIKAGHPFPPRAAPPRGHALHPAGRWRGVVGCSPQPSRRGRATPPYGRGCPTTPHPSFGRARPAPPAAITHPPPRGCFPSHPCGVFVLRSPFVFASHKAGGLHACQHRPQIHARRQGIPSGLLADYSALRRGAAPPASSRSRSLFAVVSVSQQPATGMPCRYPPALRVVRQRVSLPPYPRTSPCPPLPPRLGTLPLGSTAAPPFAPFGRCPGGTPILCFGGSLPPPNPC